jgi:hypothetical protein
MPGSVVTPLACSALMVGAMFFIVTITFGPLIVLSEGSVGAALVSGDFFLPAPSPFTCPDHRRVVRVDVAKSAVPERLYG